MRLPQAAVWGLVVASAAAENASSPANATLAPTGASEAFGNATASNATQEAYVDPLDQLQAAVGEAFNFTCPPGAYATDSPFLPCRWCGTGRYSATAGAKSCDVCDVGYYATDPRKAVDGVGLTIAASTCAMCPANMYSRNGSFQCAQCSLAAGEGSEPGAGGCVCAAGFYDATPGEDAPSCKSCDVAGVRSCPMGTTIATLPVKRGWWRATPSSDDVEECDHRDDCSGGAATGDGLCRHATQGPLCRICEKGYYAGSRAMDGSKRSLGCTECNGDTLPARHVRLLCVFLGVLAFLALMGACAMRYRRAHVMRILAVGHRLLKETKGKLDPLQVSLEGTDYKSKVWNYVRPKIKSVVAFCQICAAMELNLDGKFPTMFSNYWRFWDIFVNFDAVAFLPFNCALGTFESRLHAATLWPLAVIGLLWLSTLWTRGLKRPAATGASIGLLYLVFPSISVFILWTFSCDRFDYDEDNHRYAYVMTVDSRVRCDSAERQRVVVYAGLCCAIYPAIPLFFFVLLWRLRFDLSPRPFIDARHRLVGLTALLAREIEHNPKETTTTLLTNLRDAIILQQQRMRDKFKELEPLEFLFREYKPHAWFWEPVDCGRRLFLAGFIVLIARGEAAQLFVALFVSICFLYLINYTKPFVEEHDNTIGETCAFLLTVIFLVTLARKVDTSDDSPSSREFYRHVLLSAGIVVPSVIMAGVFLFLVFPTNVSAAYHVLARDGFNDAGAVSPVNARPRHGNGSLSIAGSVFSDDLAKAARRGRTSINDSFSHVLDLFSLNRHHKHAATGASPPAAPPDAAAGLEPLRFDDGGDDDAAGDASPPGLAPSCEVSADGFDVVDVRASSPAGSPAGSTASPPRSPMSAAIIDTEHCGVACLPGLVTDDDRGGDGDGAAADAYADLVSVLSFT